MGYWERCAPVSSGLGRWKTGEARLKLINKTRYDGRNLRRWISAGLRVLRVNSNPIVEVTYARKANGFCTGRARYDGTRMWLRLQRPELLRPSDLSYIIEHEALHLRGVRHREMTPSQLRGHDILRSWAKTLPLPREKKERGD